MSDVIVSSGQTYSNETITFNGGVTVLSGGEMIDITFSGFSEGTVNHGGIAIGTTLDGYGAFADLILYGTASDTIIQGGNGGDAQEFIYSGAIDSHATINFRGYQEIETGGTSEYATLTSGGFQSVYTGATADFATILGGGQQRVLSGGIASSTIVDSGGGEGIDSGGIAFMTTVNSGGGQGIGSGGLANSAIINSGGFQNDYGLATQTIVHAGGSQTILGYKRVTNGQTSTTSGTAISSIVNGGQQSVSALSIAVSTTITSGGVQNIAGGTASNTILSGSALQNVAGGTLVVYSLSSAGGTYNSTVGSTTSTYTGSAVSTVLNGGTEIISSGGIATGTDIFSGGAQTILAGGSATGTQMYLGTETISSGGVARGTVIYAGGQVIVSSGGLLVNSPIGSNGEVTVQSGGVVSTARIAGGTLDLAGGKAVGPITFSNTGGKLLAADAVPASIISGFAVGDEIVLGSITYKAGAKVMVKSAGVVTIANNNKAYNLKIAGAVVGETDFKFSSGSVLTKVAAPSMAFLAPAANPDTPMTDAVVLGAGREMFGMYDVPAVAHGGYMAHEGWRPVFYGVPMSIGLHPQ